MTKTIGVVGMGYAGLTLTVAALARAGTILEGTCDSALGARLSVLGWAYKGWPATDDMRGTPVAAMMRVFDEAGIEVYGHDPMVADDVVRGYGGRPVSLDSWRILDESAVRAAGLENAGLGYPRGASA